MELENLKQILYYDKNTGIFTWLVNMPHNPMINKRAGYKSINGYRIISINKKKYYEARLAWFYMTDKWPKFEIDHINRIKDDNRWCNLREATRSQNCANSIKNKNNTLPRGVSFHKRDKKYQAQCKYQGKHYHLGFYKTVQEAKQAYDKFVLQHHREFAII
jgi:hypothetical protein